MPTMDIFNNDAFSVRELTARSNERPFVPGQVGRMGLFEEDSVAATTIQIEVKGNEISIIQPTPRGGPGETTTHGKRGLIPFNIPHFQRDDSVLADEVQNVRAFGTDDELETVISRVDAKAARHEQDLDVTMEHSRVLALKGVILGPDGGEISLYQRFGVDAPATVDWELDAAGPPEGAILAKCDEMVDEIEDELGADPYDHIHCLCGKTFFETIWRSKEVRDTFKNTIEASVLRQGTPRRFEYGNIVFERYRTGKSLSAFIGPDDAHFFPRGVPGLFLTRFAPADYEETVNTPGLPRYVRQWAMPNGKGRHLEVQSNFINLCRRPRVLRKATRT